MKLRHCAFLLLTNWLVVSGCGSPTEPHPAALENGRWAGNGTCLAVADTGCNFVAGCGHGVFPKPNLRTDGTFDVDGTYRIEVGPVSPNPAPPAHFSGSVTGSTLTLIVTPSGQPAATYSLTLGGSGTCAVPCV